MTRYLMRDTPLCQMEQQMMTPPYFKPRGYGRYYPGFQYSRDDMECPYCMNFRRNHPCPLEQCVCLDERIVAGAIDLNEFVRDCFFPEVGVQLQARLERSFNIFHSHGYDLRIDNELVAEAFAVLPQQEQSILILHCVMELNDVEIGRLMGMSKSAVQRHRTKTLKELRVKLMAIMPEGG